MAEIILDISANSHRNDFGYYMKMIEELAKVDTHKHLITIKAQLFEKSHINIIQDRGMFQKMYFWTKQTYGYQVTASVFDKSSLDFLLQYNPCFIKIACNPDYYWLIGEIPRRYKVYVSVYEYFKREDIDNNMTTLYCVPQYPADITQYPSWDCYISDHTIGLDLWYRNIPEIWEKHYVLEHDNRNPDGGLWATTPDELRSIL